jgi:RNA polymerase sigma-70 factor (ECF subfamily)
MSKDINALLALAAEGDMNAFGDVYKQLSVRVFNYARALTRSNESAEDVTHDVFIQILKQAARLTKMTDPVAYIMVAARNRSYDQIKRDNRPAISFDDIHETGGAALPDDRLLIDDAFSTLPASQRETLYLHHICGFSQKEVAKITGAPLVTVKWRCGKALSRLQAYFKQDEEVIYNETQ